MTNFAEINKKFKPAYNFILKPGVLIPLITVVVYIIGLNSYKGYLAKFNIEETLFTLSLDRVMNFGYEAVSILAIFLILFIIGSIVFITLINVFVDELFKKIEKAGYYKKYYVVGKSEKVNAFVTFAESAFKINTALVIILFVYLSILIMPLITHKFGIESAELFIEEANSNKSKSVSLVFRKPEICIDGYFSIICNLNLCAFYKNGNTHIYMLSDLKEIKNTKCNSSKI